MAPRSRAVAVASAIHRALEHAIVTPPLAHSLPPAASTSIVIDQVTVRRDLRTAQVHVSAFAPITATASAAAPAAGQLVDTASVVDLLGRHTAQLRLAVGQQVRLRHTPHLHFVPTRREQQRERAGTDTGGGDRLADLLARAVGQAGDGPAGDGRQ
mmetsp:Transcript_3411/g.11185  ORF Transcript_3411/g.11185 Transcript_3411/m.11185 type:complete len:156 (-) Transcript_3411:1305-1772(-)